MAARSRDKYAEINAEPLQLGAINGNCLEAWAPPETVENAHDQANKDPRNYTAPLNNNVTTSLAPAPDANR